MRQSVTLAPKLQQSVKLLQMSTLEFQQAVRHALDSNPFLEEPEDGLDGETEGMAVGNALRVVPDQNESILPMGPADEAAETPENLAAIEPQSAYPGDYPRPYVEGYSDPTEREATAGSLREQLFRALGALPLSVRDRNLAAYLIDSLDGDGYLRSSLDELASAEAFDPAPEEREWRTALYHVQHMLAPGIGARDLRECLLLQLRACHHSTAEDSAHRLAVTIVEDHLPRMARNDWAGLLRELDVDGAALKEAFDLIRTLDPRPGLRYDEGPVQYVIPDVVVDKVSGHWRVRLNRAAMPQARLHRQYADWLRNARCADREPLAQELQEAQWLIRNIEQRYTTIRRVAEAIVLRQRRFFDYGDVALRPMMLREVADDLEIHESTVSRATANKYMITPRGLLEFRHFFSRELGTQTGGTCSANAVRALIQELVEAEDTTQPLSDVDLTHQLARHGIVVARRTVTKYRGQLHIPAVELRRVHAQASVE